MNKKQSGFGVVEVAIIVVVLLMIGAVGWSAYRAFQKEDNKASEKLQTSSQQEPERKTDVPAGYRKYENKEYGINFIYPSDWSEQAARDEDNEAGVIIGIVSPEVDKTYKEAMAAALGKDAPARSDVIVSHWDNINNMYATGGTWSGQRQYVGLEDYLSDTHPGKPKQKVSELTVNGQKAYEVIIGGLGSSYGIMFERQNGIYQIEFPPIWEKKDATEEVRKIIESFKFE